MRDRLVGLAERHKEDMLRFCQELIRTPSLPGQEGEIAKLVAQRMEALGYDRVWIDEAGNAIGPMNGVSLDWYPSDTQRGYAEILMNADTFRFDGSDLMPGAVGAGSFWSEATSWVGGKSLDEVLTAIDASWPE